MSISFTRNIFKQQIDTGYFDIGEHTYGVPQVLEWGEGAKLKIGKYCSIATGVKILLGGQSSYRLGNNVSLFRADATVAGSCFNSGASSLKR